MENSLHVDWSAANCRLIYPDETSNHEMMIGDVRGEESDHKRGTIGLYDYSDIDCA